MKDIHSLDRGPKLADSMSELLVALLARHHEVSFGLRRTKHGVQCKITCPGWYMILTGRNEKELAAEIIKKLESL